MRARSIFLLTILATGLLAGCRTDIGQDIAAVVNGRPIRIDDLVTAERSWVQKPDTPEKGFVLRQRVLRQLIEEELILQEAERRGLRPSNEELDKVINEVKADYPGRSFEEMLIREYISLEAWREKIRRNLLLKKIIDDEVGTRTDRSESKWEAFVRTSGPPPQKSPLVQVKHLTLTSRGEAEWVLKQLKAGADFDRLARDLAGPAQKGETSQPIWIKPTRLPAAMAEAIMTTPPGRVSRIVESQYGFSIFKIMTVEELGEKSPPERVAEQQRRFMDQQKSEAYNQWIEELKSRAKIIINPSLTLADQGGPKPSGAK